MCLICFDKRLHQMTPWHFQITSVHMLAAYCQQNREEICWSVSGLLKSTPEGATVHSPPKSMENKDFASCNWNASRPDRWQKI